MDREKFLEWLKSCPAPQVDEPDGFNDEFYHCGWYNYGWCIQSDKGDAMDILFWFDTGEERDEDVVT